MSVNNKQVIAMPYKGHLFSGTPEEAKEFIQQLLVKKFPGIDLEKDIDILEIVREDPSFFHVAKVKFTYQGDEKMIYPPIYIHSYV